MRDNGLYHHPPLQVLSLLPSQSHHAFPSLQFSCIEYSLLPDNKNSHNQDLIYHTTLTGNPTINKSRFTPNEISTLPRPFNEYLSLPQIPFIIVLLDLISNQRISRLPNHYRSRCFERPTQNLRTHHEIFNYSTTIHNQQNSIIKS